MGCRVASAPEFYHSNLHIWLRENWRRPFVPVKEEIQISGVEGRGEGIAFLCINIR